MARTPAPWLPFPEDTPPEPGAAPAPPDDVPNSHQGGPHAVQDDRPGTPSATPGDVRPAPPSADAPASTGPLRHRAEGQSRILDGPALPGEAGERFGPGGERGPGDRLAGAGGEFAAHLRAGGGRAP